MGEATARAARHTHLRRTRRTAAAARAQRHPRVRPAADRRHAGLLDGATLRQLPRGAYLVNVGRGEHLVEADLRALLDEGHLAGAALDVFEREPPKRTTGSGRPRVLATPHIAAQASVGRSRSNAWNHCSVRATAWRSRGRSTAALAIERKTP